MTTPLFEEIGEAMDEDEMEISRSTPTARFEPPAPAAKPVAVTAPVEPSAKALAHVDEIIADKKQPVVFFSLQWCEFSWSARKLLDMIDVPYRTVALDGPEYANLDWAADVRRALAARCGAPTIPQTFVGGKHLGGATELFDIYNERELGALLAEVGLTMKDTGPEDAYSMLPKWLQPR